MKLINKYVFSVSFLILFRMRQGTVLFFFLASHSLFAQKDMPNPPADYQVIPAGSYIIAMDTAYQKIVTTGAFFNLKSYGLVNQFLQNQFPVKWAIKAGKTLNGIDFTALARREYPSPTSPSFMDFRGGPFIVPDTTICGLTSQSIIQSFGNNVSVYRLMTSELIDIRYTITNAPKIAIFTNGGNEQIHAKILNAAGISDYDFMDAADISQLSDCYSLVSEPHWDFNDADSIVVNGVKDFVINGGNFLAQCQALETYENIGFFATTSGINVLNKNMVHMYHNADLPVLQINGLVTENQGGSVRNFAPKPGSTWQGTTYKVISHNGSDSSVCIGMHLASPSTEGGNAFLLGSHDYYGLNNLKDINALRLYLNVALMPSVNNNIWAKAGIDQAMSCAGATSLGCEPTGPPGSTYSWTPSSGLSCTNCPNPSAVPMASTTYTVTVTNASGCTATDVVYVSTNLVYPVANFSTGGGGDSSACVNEPMNFVDQSTNGAVQWAWDFGDGSVSNAQNPTHAYSNPGTYTVTLTATNIMGCTSSVQHDVQINPNPVPGFTFTPACFGHTTCFTNSSYISSGSISWSWDFGDTSSASNTSTLENPCHDFIASSTDITLTVTSDVGCQATLTQPIVFSPDPVAAFSSTVSCEYTQTCFTDLSTVSSGNIVGWSWNFNDTGSGTANSSTDQNPCHLYSDYVSKTAELTVTTDNGCQNSVTMPVAFRVVPVADFTANIPCHGDASCFTNLSTISSGTIASYYWMFDDPASGVSDTSTLQNPCHTFTTASSFNVTLILTSDLGCDGTVTLPVEVAPIPVASFTPAWACLGSQTCFTNLSTIASGTIANYSWTFNDLTLGTSDTSTLQSPCYLFSTYNSYSASLILQSDYGCSDTATSAIQIYPNPVANFSSTVVCPGIMTCFNDLSSVSSGSIVGWNWNFSDSLSAILDSSSVQNPCHMFLNTSSPQVTLTVTTDIGCQNTVTYPVSFSPAPIADFSATEACLGSQTTFTDLSTISTGVIISRTWNFGEPGSGLANTSMSQNPDHTYSSSDVFNVTLTTVCSNGCESEITRAVEVSPIPVANFSAAPLCLGSPTCFTDLSTISSGSITSHSWSFDDPGSGTANNSVLQNPCHTFPTLSPYNVSLILTSDNGCSDTIIKAIAVNPIPAVSFASTTVCPGDQNCFTGTSTISSGSLTTWHWEFSDPASGASDSSGLQNPCHTFINVSSPIVSLTVTSDKGCQNTFSLPVNFNPVPEANFNGTVSCLQSPACFTDLSTITSGAIASMQWNFGDINSGSLNYSSAQNPCHVFSTVGNFDVTLTITSDNGCQDNITLPSSVSPLPLADFSYSTPCINDQTCFIDASSIASGSVTAYEWNFDDVGSGASNASSIQNPCHIFPTFNQYNVSLILTSDLGCRDSVTIPVSVSPVPVANFSLEKVCPGDATCFTDLSTISSGSIANWKWNFIQAGSIVSDSANQNPCHVYSDTLLTAATLTVISDNGCESTFTYPVDFNPVPVPDFDISTACYGTPTCFNDLSSISPGSITNYSWNFDDINSGAANSSTAQSACHTFSSVDSFNVTLEITSDLGCENSVVRPLRIISPPVANFTTNSVCINSYSEFKDESTCINDTINEWEWDFGDGTIISNIRTPQHKYDSARTYNVVLRITGTTGCSDTINVPVTVHAQPVANVSSPLQGCAPVCETFSDLSTPGDGFISSRQWSFPGAVPNYSTQQNPVICYSNKGFYHVSLIVTNSFGCSDTLESDKHVKVFPIPEADFYVIKEPDNLYSPELTLGHNWSYDVIKWYWDFGDGSPLDSVNEDPSHIFKQPIMENDYYSFSVNLNVSNQFGCAMRVSREFNIKPAFSFFIPNTFTPNDDSPNDYFYGKGRGISDYRISIFDRWGKLVWSCEEDGDFKEWDKDNSDGMPAACKWDGIIKGRVVQNDTYVWKVELKNVFGELFKYMGHVNVVK